MPGRWCQWPDLGPYASLKEDTELKLYKWEDPEGKYAYWHSSAHLMAEALQALYPGVKFGIGPAIENGFYYDIDLGEGVQLRDADLAAIEAKMAEFAARKEPIIRRDITKAEVTKFFEEKGDEYKLELIADLPRRVDHDLFAGRLHGPVPWPSRA